MKKKPQTGPLHVGRSWVGHPLEDECPCPSEPCGLVSMAKIVDDCPEHGVARTIRQAHWEAECPGE